MNHRMFTSTGMISQPFWLVPVTLARNLGFSGVELRRVQGLVVEHEVKLLEAWNEFFRRTTG